MAAASSSAPPGLLRLAPLSAARAVSFAKPRGFLHSCARVAPKPRASLSSVSARVAVTRGAEHLPDYVRLLYAELHDGELSPGVVMTSEDMLLLAQLLANLGADTNKVGSSPEDLEVLRSIAMDVIAALRSIVEDGKDGRVLVVCGLFGCNERDNDTWEAQNGRNIGIIFLPTSSKVLTLPVKPEQVLDIAKEAVSYAFGIGMPQGRRQVVMAGRCRPELLGGLYTGVNIQESSTMASKMDLNGIHKFKGTSETTSSGDIGSRHENGFYNGKLSGSHTVGAKLVELGHGKEIKDPCTCVKEDAEEEKLPASLGSRLHTVGKFIHFVYTRQEAIWFMWKMAQPCLRVIPFSVPVIVLGAGSAAMWYGTEVVLKAAESTSHSA